MDGDSTAKTLDKAASSAAPHTDFADESLPETSRPAGEPVGQKTTGTGTPAFDAQGAIGKQFRADGAIGGVAQKLGGPFDKDGGIGKHFTTGGAIGGSVQEHLGKGESNSVRK